MGRTWRGAGGRAGAAAAALAALLAASTAGAQAAASAPGALEPALAERYATLALGCAGREYPNKVAHVLAGDADARPPRELTPAFFGCYDWHSAVHAHWLLARLLRLHPDAGYAAAARAALDRSLTPGQIAGEVRYLEAPGRVAFERPYGLAWLLQLGAELREWEAPDARRWSAALDPLERAAAGRLGDWLPKLSHPVRSGEHSQTAFALGLALDWATAANDTVLASRIDERVRAFYVGDESCPLGYEPSGEDFLSPCLAEADLMRRVLPMREYANWLKRFLKVPEDGSAAWLPVAMVGDRTDPKLVHLDGLNLSRAWMLEGIAAHLPAGDRRLAALRAASAAHREAGLRAIAGQGYEGGHWLGTFAVYLATSRGGSTAFSR